jgi:hypothetical protein
MEQMLKKPPYHPPDPGAPRRAFSHAAFSHRSDLQRTGRNLLEAKYLSARI